MNLARFAQQFDLSLNLKEGLKMTLNILSLDLRNIAGTRRACSPSEVHFACTRCPVNDLCGHFVRNGRDVQPEVQFCSVC